MWIDLKDLKDLKELTGSSLLFLGLVIHPLCIFIGIDSFGKVPIFSILIDTIYFIYAVLETIIAYKIYDDNNCEGTIIRFIIITTLPIYISYISAKIVLF